MESSNYKYAEIDLHDYSTPHGKLSLLVSRINWKWTAGTILLGALVGLPFLFASEKDGVVDSKYSSNSAQEPHPLFASSPSNILYASQTTSASDFLFDGPENTLSSFVGYNEIISREKGSLTSLTLRNAYVDAPLLSQALEGFTNLQSIWLENVWLTGNFTRVFLPKLSQFIYQQNREDKRDSYKSPGTLKLTLFFDKVQGATWDVEKDLLNLGVIIRISKAGTRLIEVNRPAGEVYLNVKYGQSVLENLQGAISSFTLINSNISEEIGALVPNNLKYLNMRNTIPSSEALVQILKRQTQLTEFYGYFKFHCDWPGYEVFLNFADLPKSVRKVGVNNMDVSCNPGFQSSVTDFSVGDFISPKVVENFDIIFVNVKRVGIYNISAPLAYPLLRNALKTKAEAFALVNFERISLNSSSFVGDSEATNFAEVQQTVKEIETLLLTLGIGTSETDFLIEIKAGGLRSARVLLESEKHSLRYKGLGFDKMDTLEDYILWDSLMLPNKSDKILFAVNWLCILVILVTFVF